MTEVEKRKEKLKIEEVGDKLTVAKWKLETCALELGQVGASDESIGSGSGSSQERESKSGAFGVSGGQGRQRDASTAEAHAHQPR
jgi:hypothetical protein